MEHAKKVLAVVLGFYLTLVLGMYLAQGLLVYPGAFRAVEAPGRAPIEVAWADGVVPVLWMPVEGPAVVWFHGNGEQLPHTEPIGVRLNRRGVAMGAVEYPGFGQARGPGPSEAAILAAARAGLDRIRTLAGRDVACVGHSMGTGIAVAMAAEGRCTALVLVSPFTSVEAVAAGRYWFLPVRVLLRDRWDSLARAPSVTVPTLVTHGDQDIVVPVQLGRVMAAAIPGAEWIERPGKGHMDVLDDATFRAIARHVGAREGARP